MVSPGNYVIFRDTPTFGAYHAVRVSDGVEIVTDPVSAAPVLQQALDQDFLQDPSSGFGAGDIYVRSALYELGIGFAGLNVRSNTRLTLDPTALLQVPSGYGGAVFVFDSNNTDEVQHTEVAGGTIRESQPAQHLWTAFLLQATASDTTGQLLPHGIFFNKIRDTIVREPAVALALHVTGNKGFINANTFEFLRIWGAGVYVEFSVIPEYQLGEEDFGILYNLFFDLNCQTEEGINPFRAGIQDVSGVHNTFSEVNPFDVPGGQPLITIGPKADRTLVIGGILAGEPNVISDQGTATKIV